MFKRLLALLISIFLMTSCTTHQLVEGGIYAIPKENGKFVVAKILKLDEHGVHVRMYSNIFDTKPKKVNEKSLYMAGFERKPGEELGMGHLPISKKSFSTWGASLVQSATVTKEELEGYEM